jgi:hypothetical protein
MMENEDRRRKPDDTGRITATERKLSLFRPRQLSSVV